MNISLLDWTIIIVFFILCITIAIAASKKVNDSSDYLLAGKKMGKIATAFGVAATDFGGSGLVGCAGLAYTIGISGGWWDLAAVPAWLILGFVMAASFQKIAVYTIPEYLEKRYNSTSRLIAAVTSIVGSSVSTTAQLTVAAIALRSITGWEQYICLIIATGLVLLYTATGGLLSVVWTDVMQYIILMVGLIIALPCAVFKVGGIETMVTSVPSSYWDLGALGFSEPFGWILMGFFSYGVSQSFVQRLFAAKDPKTARFAYIYTGINYIFYSFAVAVLGICAAILIPGLSDPETAMTELIRVVLPNGVRGLMLAAIFAATISTSTSILNACTTLFTVDIYKRFLFKDADDKNVLITAKIMTVLLALFSLAGTFVFKSVVDMVVWANIIYSAGVFFPVILGMKLKWITSKAAICSIISGGFMGVISNAFLYGQENVFGKIHPIIFGSMISLFVLIAVSAIDKRGRETKVFDDVFA